MPICYAEFVEAFPICRIWVRRIGRIRIPVTQVRRSFGPTWAEIIPTSSIHFPNLERTGYFRFPAVPIFLTRPPVTAIHLA